MAETAIPSGHAVSGRSGPSRRTRADEQTTSVDRALGGRTAAQDGKTAGFTAGAAADSARDGMGGLEVMVGDTRATQGSKPGPGAVAAGFTLTKAELADLLFEQVGLNKREAKDMVDAFFDEIRDTLERGGCVKLSGFGNFQLRDKPQRPGRNPKTGEEIPISARRVVTFHASQKLILQIEGNES